MAKPEVDKQILSKAPKVNLGANWIMGERNPLLEYFRFGKVDLEKIPCNANDYDDIQILDFSENPDSVSEILQK